MMSGGASLIGDSAYPAGTIQFVSSIIIITTAMLTNLTN